MKNCLNCGNFMKREPCSKCMRLGVHYGEWKRLNIFNKIRIEVIKLITGVK